MKEKEKKQKINIIFNYSSIQLTEDMINILNRGLNFSILPLNLDLTQILTDFHQFERSMIWREFWYGREDEKNKTVPIFKIVKRNLPKNHKTPDGLSNFLGAVKSELVDPKNRKKGSLNIPQSELKALKELIKLQKERHIVIKPCDKGAGVIILDFEEYIKACETHLNAILDVPNEPSKKYYEKVDILKVEEAKLIIDQVLKEGYDNDILNREEFTAMSPENKGPGRFYCTFKVHKKHAEGTTPPERPIISCSGSLTENIGLYVEHQIKYLAITHDSYLQDTPDFLRHIEELNSKMTLPENAILVSMDVSALYTNIPLSEGLECTREALKRRKNKEVPTEFIIRLLEIVLTYNIFEFNQQLYRQIIGTAMGSRPAPPFANLFMAGIIDKKIKDIIQSYENNNESLQLKLFKRFLDDLFFVFIGSTQVLHKLICDINSIHPNIKLTMEHTSIPGELNPCECPEKPSISFLDTSLIVQDGKIYTDLYKKPTDRNQYLLPSSCHPPHCVKNIPFSLAMRIVRICSLPDKRDERLEELRKLLRERNYREGMVDAAIKKARAVPRDQALRYVAKQVTHTRPIYSVTFDSRLPNISAILHKHWRSMTKMDPYLQDVFPKPPLTAYRRQRNLKDFAIRAKVYPRNGHHEKRKLEGMKKCNKPCQACPFIQEGKFIKSETFTWKIRKSVNCESKNVIYTIECNLDKCKQRYIGETERFLKKRISEHVGYVKNKITKKSTGNHFNLPGHSLSNMKVTVIEKVKKVDLNYRKEREHHHIRKFKTHYKGMNRMP